MLQKFLLSQAVKAAAKRLPADQREKVEKLVKEKPELVMELVAAIQDEVKQGKGMEEAMRSILEKRGGELKALLA